MTASTNTVSLGELLDRLLDTGVVIAGQVQLGLAEIDLVHLDLRALLTGIESARRRAGLPVDALPHRRAARAPTSPPPRPPALPSRVELDDERPERGLVGLVLLLVDVLRDVMEGQALARMQGGSLTSDEVERLGRALHLLDQRIEALRDWLNDDHHVHPLAGAKGDFGTWR